MPNPIVKQRRKNGRVREGFSETKKRVETFHSEWYSHHRFMRNAPFLCFKGVCVWKEHAFHFNGACRKVRETWSGGNCCHYRLKNRFSSVLYCLPFESCLNRFFMTLQYIGVPGISDGVSTNGFPCPILKELSNSVSTGDVVVLYT